jgi:hypothetical protein
MSPPLPSHVPTSPNLSILGKLRSLHDQSAEPLSLSQSSARSPSPGMKQEDGASMHSSQQYDRGGHTHQHGRGGKRGRGEYNETPSPYNAPSPNPHQQQHHQHHGYGYSSGKTPHYGSGGYGMSIASPAMVGSLPPQLGSSNSVDASPATFSRALNVDVSSPSGHATPRRALQKAAAKQQAATPRNPRTKNLLNINHANVDTSAAAEQEQMEAENEFAAENAVSAGTGSGSSCHQCVSSRLADMLLLCSCDLVCSHALLPLSPLTEISSSHRRPRLLLQHVEEGQG